MLIGFQVVILEIMRYEINHAGEKEGSDSRGVRGIVKLSIDKPGKK
jgi:hypothetical protein